jgi:hypothetical protein
MFHSSPAAPLAPRVAPRERSEDRTIVADNARRLNLTIPQLKLGVFPDLLVQPLKLGVFPESSQSPGVICNLLASCATYAVKQIRWRRKS